MQLLDALRAVPEGVTIRVEVSPGSRSAGVSGLNPWRQTICIKLTERAQAGKANEQLIRYLALLFNKSVGECATHFRSHKHEESCVTTQYCR